MIPTIAVLYLQQNNDKIMFLELCFVRNVTSVKQ